MSDRRSSKMTQFRNMLNSGDLEFIMEAHNGLSAKIVEETGFKGIWGSGLSISAALGVRDNNEASWTQVLEVMEFMSDATSVPIMLDGDTGYGNFNNMRRLVRKLCQRDVAAVCIEDKLFPKTNSFIGDAQPLADIDEFCGKIKAGKDSQTHDDFSIVARIEALISGWGLDEALRRAEAYHAAGADAILMHSKIHQPTEILDFMKEWDKRCPVVIVPTMYYATPTDVFRDAGVSMIIWANHNLRAAISAMRDVSQRIYDEQTLINIEDKVVEVRDIFSIQGNDELKQAEKTYLPTQGRSVAAVILAASRGEQLGTLTADKPKAMIDVQGQPLLTRLTAALQKGGVRSLGVVRGYMKEQIDLPGVKTFDNDAYHGTGTLASLACARELLNGETLVSYGDILFRSYILHDLFQSTGDITLVVDASWQKRKGSEGAEFVSCSRSSEVSYLEHDELVELTAIGNDLAPESIDGEWIGLMRLSAKGASAVRNALDAMEADGTLGTASMPALFDKLMVDSCRIEVRYIDGGWLDVDNAFDLAQARNFI